VPDKPLDSPIRAWYRQSMARLPQTLLTGDYTAVSRRADHARYVQRGPGRCRKCGALHHVGVNPASCAECPGVGTLEVTGFHCDACGQCTTASCKRCWDCVAGEQKRQCESPVHGAEKLCRPSHLGRFAWRTKGQSLYRECAMCFPCASKLRATWVHDEEFSDQPAIGMDLSLQTGQAPWKPWAPSQTPSAVGSYVFGAYVMRENIMRRGVVIPTLLVVSPRYMGLPESRWRLSHDAVVSQVPDEPASGRSVDWIAVRVDGVDTIGKLGFSVHLDRDMAGCEEWLENSGALQSRAWAMT